MSVIAQTWAYSQRIGSSAAKMVLAFLASHNFAGDQSCFKIKTICDATELSVSSVKRALLLLHSKNLILKRERFDSSGKQLSNEYILNIPEEYKESYYDNYRRKPVDKSIGEGITVTPPPVHCDTPPSSHRHPLNNNINNNINNKSFSTKDQKKPNPVHNSPSQRLKAPSTHQVTGTTHINRSTFSEEARQAKRGDVKTAEFYLSNMKGIRLKRYHNTESAGVNGQ